ncbi:MAG: hypothetical protein HFF06_00850 [Oscillospiraceae bacterium]|jgi:cystathionine beta-lyase family protein involved in aluminum resistance|nr:hypothetical protein [Oscillospiraceae bacterium]
MPLQISDKTRELSKQAEGDLKGRFTAVDTIAQANAEKVLDAFQTYRVAESDFVGTTGYGYDDMGRDKLEKIYAHIFRTEDALVRLQMVNGTHAITCALFGALKPGEKLLYVVGAPYDTIQSAIGITGNAPGSLRSYGISYGQVELNQEEKPDLPAIAQAVREPSVKAVVIQRSRGYATRPSLSVGEIGAICDTIHSVRGDIAILVDNCYGEFVELLEPTEVGADLVMGSLIKNPGGGLAPMGGYLAGRHDLIEGAAMRLTVPGIGKECGASLGNNRSLYQGIFLAPHVTAQAVKTALFAARMMELLGYQTDPLSTQSRHDIIQMIHFGSPEPLKKFCRGIQQGAPVDSYVTPEPWDMPGYDTPVIMAAGAFIQGASIELSCDAPMREPYTAYLQGGLTYESGKLGILLAVEALQS